MDKSYIVNETAHLEGKERTKRVSELAVFYNVSRQTIWRVLNEAGIKARAKRSDSGTTKLDDVTLKNILARIKISKQSQRKRFTCSIKKAVTEVAKEQNIDMPISYERITGIMRSRGVSIKDMLTPTPYATLRSTSPNHVHLFDVTNCLQWHLKNGGGLKEDDLTWLYKNKVVEGVKSIEDKRQLLRFVLVDHCSGAFFFWYYYATGERSEDGADFFYRAWSEKQSLTESILGIKNYYGYQFCGTPEILFTDKGSIIKKKEILNLMVALDIKVMFHKAGNPRAKGKVEGLMKIIGYDFESDLRIYNIQNLDDLNRFALKWCIERNRELGFRNNQQISRIKLWNKIISEDLRLIPSKDIYYTLIHNNDIKRTVAGNGVIRYSGMQYFCPDVNACYKEVKISTNAKEYPAISIHFNGFVYKAEPLDYDDYGRLNVPDAVTLGSYKAKQKTESAYLADELEDIARENYGVDFKGAGYKRIATPPKGEKLPEYELGVDKKIFDIKRNGVAINTPNINAPLTETIIDPTPINKFEDKDELVSINLLIKRYIAEYGTITTEENKSLRERFGDNTSRQVTTAILHNYLKGGEQIIKLNMA